MSVAVLERPRARLLAVTGGAALLPLLVLFGLNLVDELDRAAFATLTPEIRASFGLSNAQFLAIVTSANAVVILAALPVGRLADRVDRIRLARAVALLWAFGSVLVGVSPVIAVLVVGRLLGGLGRISNEPLHASLLADYYAPRNRPQVYAVHRLANFFGNVIGPVVAVVIAAVAGGPEGWRWAFGFLAIPTVLLVLRAGVLRDPGRHTDTVPVLSPEALPEAGPAVAHPLPPIPLRTALRTLAGLSTLRRLWLSAVFFGAGVGSLSIFISAFANDALGIGPGGRSALTVGFGVSGFLGLLLAGRLASRTVASGNVPGLALQTGGAITLSGLAILIASGLPLVPSVAMLLLAGLFLESFFPAYLPLVAEVAPARLRASAYGSTITAVAIGAIFVGIPVGGISDSAGPRVGFAALGIAMTLGGLIAASARRCVVRDLSRRAADPQDPGSGGPDDGGHGGGGPGGGGPDGGGPDGGGSHGDGPDGVAPEDDAALVLPHLPVTPATVVPRQATGRPLLECRGVQVAYDGVQVLFGVDLVVEPGEVVALLGTNGAGKSTLLKAVAGLAPVTGGSVLLDGEDLVGTPASKLSRKGVALVPGGKGVFGSLTVAEHLRLSGWGADKTAHASGVQDALALLPRLSERLETAAGDLSGGEQQMLALAIAFVGRPRLLMIDELSLGLAPAVVATLLEAVRAVSARGTTIVLVEQSVNVALTVASRATFLEKGRVVFSGPTADLLERPDVLRSVLLAGSQERLETAARTQDDDGEVRLRAEGLVKRYGGVTAVDHVSFEVRAGEVVGILGPNGSGKTSLLDLLAGTTDGDGGRVLLGDVDITGWSSRRRALAGLGRSFQDAKLFPALTVAQNVAVALERHLEVRDPLADVLHLPATGQVEEDVRWTVGDLLALTGLTPLAERSAGDLSTGTRRVLDLTMALAHDPSVLLLDEPGAGIAQREAEALGPLLRRVAAATGCALVLVEHDVPLLRGLCDRLVAMVEGAVVTVGTPDEVLAHPVVVAAYLGGDSATVERSGTGKRPAPARAPRKRAPRKAVS